MDKSEIHNLAGSQEVSAKNHFLAWDREYAHLKWGGPAPVRDHPGIIFCPDPGFSMQAQEMADTWENLQDIILQLELTFL